MQRFLSIFLILGMLFSNNIALAGKGYSSGSGRSYSSSSSRSYSSSSSRSFSSSKPVSSSKPSTITPSKSYSSGVKGYSSTATKANPSTGPPSKGYSNSGTSYTSKKPGGNFQSLAATEQRKAESRAVYQKATAPKETYTTPKGKTVPIKKDDSRVAQIRNMPEEKWVNREERVKTFYSTYYNHVPPNVVHYNDSYSTFFWLWLLDRSLDDRARWAYHHHSDMDQARYRDLLAKDAKLEARIKQLEAEKKKADPNYLPTGMTDPDLPYTDAFVNASVNPTPKPYKGLTTEQFFHGVWVLMKWSFLIGLIVFLIWFVFFLEWEV